MSCTKFGGIFKRPRQTSPNSPPPKKKEFLRKFCSSNEQNSLCFFLFYRLLPQLLCSWHQFHGRILWLPGSDLHTYADQHSYDLHQIMELSLEKNMFCLRFNQQTETDTKIKEIQRFFYKIRANFFSSKGIIILFGRKQNESVFNLALAQSYKTKNDLLTKYLAYMAKQYEWYLFLMFVAVQ